MLNILWYTSRNRDDLL